MPSDAVVLVLSKEFICKPYLMEELHHLLEWQQRRSKAKVLPVLLDVTPANLLDKAKEYGMLPPPQQLWAKDLEAVAGIARISADQVLTFSALHAVRVCFWSLMPHCT
jgi:hypothetical protein